jgi:O-succinylbenzoic acid--CoA ligase
VPKGITLNHQFYSYDLLKNQTDLDLKDDYLNEVVRFCHEWLNGMKNMTIHTSGSTGEPSKILFSRSQLVSSVQATIRALGLTTDDNALICINTSYIGGRMMLIRCMELHMNAYLVRPTANPFQRIPDIIDCSFFSFVPLQLQTILENGMSDHFRNGKAIIIGGAPVNSYLTQKVKEVSTPVYHTFGMTETASHIALRRLNGKDPDLFFRPVEKINLDTDQRGCLKIKGPQTNNKWLQTNDLVNLKKSGDFRWLGRVDDVINTGGMKLLIPQLEEAIRPILIDKLDTRNYLIMKAKDERLGEKILLVLEGDISSDQKEMLLSELNNRLPKYHSPKEVITLPTIPLTETGKYKRDQVRTSINDLLA